MRGAPPVFALLLLAGCVEDVPSGAPEALEPIERACARVSLRADPPTLRWGDETTLTARIENRCDVPLRPVATRACLMFVIEAPNARTFLERNGTARPPPAERGYCPLDPTEWLAIDPGASREIVLTWNGMFLVPCAQDVACHGHAREHAALGTARVGFGLRDAGGPDVVGATSIDIVSGAPPPFEDGDVKLVVNATYRAGEQATVYAENMGDVAYDRSQLYAACDVRYYRSDGREFLIPPGTHCDLPTRTPIEPGERVALFSWDLTECTRDAWGCQAWAPLEPGVYHLRWAYREPWDGGDRTGVAGASFHILE